MELLSAIENVVRKGKLYDYEKLLEVYTKYGNLSTTQRIYVLNNPDVKNAPDRVQDLWHLTNSNFGVTDFVYHLEHVAAILEIENLFKFREEWMKKHGEVSNAYLCSSMKFHLFSLKRNKHKRPKRANQQGSVQVVQGNTF